jgi:protein-S-isoprenylcysteine O-methyltransferase Ste14
MAKAVRRHDRIAGIPKRSVRHCADSNPHYLSLMSPLTKKAFTSLICLVAVMAALLFIPAGTLDYWEAWTFLALYFAASVAITLYLMKADPALLQRRMSGGPFAEKQTSQKIIMSLMSPAFVALMVIPALDHRFGWSHMPPDLALAGDGLMLLGWLVIFFVFRENTFTSTTIELAPGQQVISTGPYARVRHPMYVGGFVMLLGMPIALGSWWGALVMVVVLPVLIWRLLDEERFLAKNLPGYTEYQRKVRYRLVPSVW